jgi:predicted ABC-type ATPase
MPTLYVPGGANGVGKTTCKSRTDSPEKNAGFVG